MLAIADAFVDPILLWPVCLHIYISPFLPFFWVLAHTTSYLIPDSGDRLFRECPKFDSKVDDEQGRSNPCRDKH